MNEVIAFIFGMMAGASLGVWGSYTYECMQFEASAPMAESNHIADASKMVASDEATDTRGTE